MYKILIVDDERMIRLGIERTIQWEKLKIGQVFTAASAQQAIHIIQETKQGRYRTEGYIYVIWDGRRGCVAAAPPGASMGLGARHAAGEGKSSGTR